MAVGLLVGEQAQRPTGLLETGPERDDEKHHDDDACHAAPIGPRQRRHIGIFGRAGDAPQGDADHGKRRRDLGQHRQAVIDRPDDLPRQQDAHHQRHTTAHPGQQRHQIGLGDRPLFGLQTGAAERFLAHQKLRQARRPAHGGSAKTVVPADLLAQGAGHQRGQEGAQVDTHVEDRITARTAWVVLALVQVTDHRSRVRLEQAVANDQQAQCQVQQRLIRHRDMAQHHHRAANHRGPALAQIPIRQRATDHRCEVNEAGVEAIQRQRVVARIAQRVDEIQHQQRTHPVVTEALPHLGEENHLQAGRLAQRMGGRILGTGRCRGVGDAHV